MHDATALTCVSRSPRTPVASSPTRLPGWCVGHGCAVAARTLGAAALHAAPAQCGAALHAERTALWCIDAGCMAALVHATAAPEAACCCRSMWPLSDNWLGTRNCLV